MVSLDLAKAFDSVPHMEIQNSLEELGVDARLIAVVMRIHTQTQCIIRQAGKEASTMMQRGLRQGCPLAPVLYAAWTSRLCRILDANLGDGWCSRHSSIFADDTLGYWDIRSTGDMRKAIREVGCLFSVFQQLGLTIDIEKSGVMLAITGVDKYAMLRACTNQWKGKTQLRVPIEGGDIYVPLDDELLYLGVVLSYSRFEHATVQHRLEFFKEQLERLGRTPRSVSGSSGRLLRQLGDAPYNVFRARVVTTLTPAARRRLDEAVAFLEQLWDEQLLPNDRTLVRALGTAADPGLSSIQQRFQLFFQGAATDFGISSSHARKILEVVRCSSEYALYQPSVEFLVRTLPARQRRMLLEWLEAERL